MKIGINNICDINKIGIVFLDQLKRAIHRFIGTKITFESQESWRSR